MARIDERREEDAERHPNNINTPAAGCVEESKNRADDTKKGK